MRGVLPLKRLSVGLMHVPRYTVLVIGAVVALFTESSILGGCVVALFTDRIINTRWMCLPADCG